MPYPRAWLWVGLLLILTVPAFWPAYLGKLGEVSWQLHVHGITAGLWVVLVMVQSWSIHHGHRALHRTAGMSSMILTPLFVAGACLVTATMAVKPGPFGELYGTRLGLLDVLTIFAFPAFVYMALRHRRSVGLHAGWMLATIFPLINPTIARLFPAFVPGLTIRSIEELPRFAGSVHLAQAIAVGIALFLYLRNRRHGTPMLAVLGFLALQWILFVTIAKSAWWNGINLQIGAMSPAVLMAFGISLGAVAVVAGWMSGGTRPAAQAPA